MADVIRTSIMSINPVLEPLGPGLPPDQEEVRVTERESRLKGGTVKYYDGDGDQFLRTLNPPPIDNEGFALFEPNSLGPDYPIIFRRMMNYKFRSTTNHPLKPLDDMKMLCVRALPDVPVGEKDDVSEERYYNLQEILLALEFAPEVDSNARLRPRTFAICGENLLPKYYAVEYTPSSLFFWNCIPWFSCIRQPFNLAIYGLDGNMVLKIVSSTLEKCGFRRWAKEWCCCSSLEKRMLIQDHDGKTIGSLMQFGHCFMTQWLQIHPGIPSEEADLYDSAVTEWQTKCRCFDFSMMNCGCKTDLDPNAPMIISDKDGKRYATARPWTGMSTEDFPFLFSLRFNEGCPVEMKTLALAASFIFNNLKWEARTDIDCCSCISCTFCSFGMWSQGGTMSMDFNNWSNVPTKPNMAYVPWAKLRRPATVNYRIV